MVLVWYLCSGGKFCKLAMVFIWDAMQKIQTPAKTAGNVRGSIGRFWHNGLKGEEDGKV